MDLVYGFNVHLATNLRRIMMSKKFRHELGKKRNRPAVRFRFSMVIFIFIITLGSFFVMHMFDANINDDEFIRNLYNNSNSGENDDGKSSYDTVSENTIQIINPVPQSTNVKGKEYWKDCALVGDLTMLKIASADTETIPKENVFAASNINIENINDTKISYLNGNDTIINLLKNSEYKYIYIMLGDDGIETLTIEQMVENYSDFIREMKASIPNSKIYIMSIPPVTEKREQMQTNGVSNLKIDQFNSELLMLANSESVYFVDVNTTLKGNGGKLPNAFTESDNITLKSSSYKLIHDYILTHTVD